MEAGRSSRDPAVRAAAIASGSLTARYGRWAEVLRRGAGDALADHVLDREPEELGRRIRVVDRHSQDVAAGAVVHLEAAAGESEGVVARLAVGRANAACARQQLRGRPAREPQL